MRSDWTVIQAGYNIIDTDFHSLSSCMQFTPNELANMSMDTNPLENGRITFWARNRELGASFGEFFTEWRKLDGNNYYSGRWFNTYVRLYRNKNGNWTDLSTWNYPVGINFDDDQWHGVGVKFWNDLNKVMIQIVGWDGSKWVDGLRFEDPNASALFGAGVFTMNTSGPAGQKVDDFVFEELAVTGP